MTMTKTAVSESALLKRINRKLAHEHERVRKTRGFYNQGCGPYFDHNLGEYYCVDWDSNVITSTHLDIEALGRNLGVFFEAETLSS
jgi:hypothetical protein